MDPDIRAELLALRAEQAADRRGRAWPQALSVAALLVAVAALLLPRSGCW